MMKTIPQLCFAAVAAAALLVAAGCTQMPTETRGVSDMRPQISFKPSSEATRAARVLLDGLDIGSVGDYLDGVSAARILPGSHVLQVRAGEAVLLEEKFYAADGVSRSFSLK
jgi:hypothetical protein